MKREAIESQPGLGNKIGIKALVGKSSTRSAGYFQVQYRENSNSG